jgi:hypothetical protein
VCGLASVQRMSVAGFRQTLSQCVPPYQRCCDTTLVGVSGLLALLVYRCDFEVRAGRRCHDLGERGNALTDPCGDGRQQRELTARVSLALHGLPVRPVPKRRRLIVAHGSHLEQFAEDGGLVPKTAYTV